MPWKMSRNTLCRKFGRKNNCRISESDIDHTSRKLSSKLFKHNVEKEQKTPNITS